MRYRNINSMPGPGDFYTREELDDGRCEDCGYEDCTYYCECEICLPTCCTFCDNRSKDWEHAYSEFDPEYAVDDFPVCNECFQGLMKEREENKE
jgi:hypothetical protein